MSEKALLEVENLRIDIVSGSSRHNVVEDVSFTIGAGETFGLVGESGCGKSITALSMIGLLRKPLSITGGAIRFNGQDLNSLSSREMRKLRGSRIAMIFQEPMTALNPLSPVGRQIAEMFVLHQGATWHEAERKAVEALANVQVPAPDQRVKNYPHQMSGGMRQRVVIALALACRPDLLIADEPTTALDVTTQAQILDTIRDLQGEIGTATILITHDLAVVAETADRVAVMYAGRIVEEATADDLFAAPRHPYTHGLMGSIPKVLLPEEISPGMRLTEIPGMVPALWAQPRGCAFGPRCPRKIEHCGEERPPLMTIGEERRLACWNPVEAQV